MATPSVAVPARRPRGALLRWGRLPAWIRYPLVLAGLIGLWQAYVIIKSPDSFFFAAPRAAADAFWTGWVDGTLARVTWETLRILAIGIGIGALVALVLNAFAAVSQIGDDVLRILVAVFNPLPGVAMLPLATIWFGLNTNAYLFVLANAAAWPIAINLNTGFKTVNPTIVAVGRNIGLSSRRLVTDVLAPAALPYAISGLKTAWAFSWRTMIAAELVFGVAGEHGGLGTFINNAKQFFEIPKVFAGLVTIAILGMLFEWIFGVIERRTLVRWGMKTQT